MKQKRIATAYAVLLMVPATALMVSHVKRRCVLSQHTPSFLLTPTFHVKRPLVLRGTGSFPRT